MVNREGSVNLRVLHEEPELRKALIRQLRKDLRQAEHWLPGDKLPKDLIAEVQQILEHAARQNELEQLLYQVSLPEDQAREVLAGDDPMWHLANLCIIRVAGKVLSRFNPDLYQNGG